jgi:hypothetical protein
MPRGTMDQPCFARTCCWQTGVTPPVPLHEPVQFEPPPPRVPPMTQALSSWPDSLKARSAVYLGNIGRKQARRKGQKGLVRAGPFWP